MNVCNFTLITLVFSFFYSNNFDRLPPKPKLSFRYLKQGIQEVHRKYVVAPADKAVVV